MDPKVKEAAALVAAGPSKMFWPKRTPRIIVADQHKGWGNSISWDGREWYGWMTPIPEVGDEIHSMCQSGKMGRFIITRVDECHDPPDMFFATTKLVGYL